MDNRRNFKSTDKLIKRISDHFMKQYELKDQWCLLKQKLEDAGTWEEYCAARGWSPDADFADFGA